MHRISIFFWIGFCIALYHDADGQVNFRNPIHAESGGNAYYYPLNFERNFSKHLAGRAGICVLPETMLMPVLAGKLFSRGNHKLEVMAGLAYVYLRQQTENIYHRHQLAGTAFMGYGFQRHEARFLFRRLDCTRKPFWTLIRLSGTCIQPLGGNWAWVSFKVADGRTL